MYAECLNGDIEAIKLTEIKGDFGWDVGLMGACLGGHIDIVNLMIEKGANDWIDGFNHACKGGHIDAVRLMIEKAESEKQHLDWNTGFNHAYNYMNTQIDIMYLLIEKGAKIYNQDFLSMCYGGHADLVRLMIEKAGSTDLDLNSGLRNACYKEHLNIIFILLEKGADIKHLCRDCLEKYYKKNIDQLDINDCASIVYEYCFIN